MTRFKFRIRRCHCNADAWALCWLRPDGTEGTAYGSVETSYSVDYLLKAAQARLSPGDRGEVVP